MSQIHIYIYTYIHIYIYIYNMCIYIYIYTYREKCVHTYTYIYIYIHIYIYIYEFVLSEGVRPQLTSNNFQTWDRRPIWTKENGIDPIREALVNTTIQLWLYDYY